MMFYTKKTLRRGRKNSRGLDVIGKLFSNEILLAVSDREKYIYYRPSN